MQPASPSASPIGELIACLSALQSSADSVFRRITDRCHENRTKIETFSARISVAKQRLAQVRDNHRRATLVMSPAKFPELDDAVPASSDAQNEGAAMYGTPIQVRCTEPTKVMSLPTVGEVHMWERPAVSDLLEHPQRPGHAQHLLGDGTSIASLIRPQLRAAKPVTSTTRPALPAGGLADQPIHASDVSGWVAPYTPVRRLAPHTFPSALPGLAHVAEDVCYADLAASSDRVATTAADLAMLPSLPPVASLPVTIVERESKAEEGEHLEPIAYTTQRATEAEAEARQQRRVAEAEKERARRAHAERQEAERKAAAEAERKAEAEAARRAQQAAAEAEAQAAREREERRRRGWHEGGASINVLEPVAVSVAADQAEAEAEAEAAEAAHTGAVKAGQPSGDAADAPLPVTERDRGALHDKRAQQGGGNEDAVHSRGGDSAFARELIERAARPRGEAVARLEAERRAGRRQRSAIASMLFDAFERKYKGSRGGDEEAAAEAEH